MSNIVIKNYATALFDSAVAEGMQDRILEQITIFAAFLKEDKNCNALLISPIALIKKKKHLIDLISKELGFAALMHRFLYILVDYKRFDILNSIVLLYYRLLNSSKNITLANVTTSRNLNTVERTETKTYLENVLQRKFTLEFVCDSTIIGGFVVEYNNYLLDCSIAGQLKKIEKITNISNW